MGPSSSFIKLWGIPIILGVLTCFGLLAALLGVGIWHGMAWAALTVPLLVGIGFWVFPRR
ncbi:hypothetical protein [Allopusillimonas ginsengisoli]|uniref:hypothetical protein n=1 Tax=Allopusillimonas ginsengisoli TaxID=453575 RepID=UPI00102242CA|nr:hypothetical protein [Allopusillimonas ginsengisoli]TEA77802.1 hypothetical protein ERE07_12310 [Allopusillimonas ginsengisoli]